jgi:hypothetical protein
MSDFLYLFSYLVLCKYVSSLISTQKWSAHLFDGVVFAETQTASDGILELKK